MSLSAPALSAVTLFVADPVASRDFYQRAFEADLVFEDGNSAAFRFGSVVVNLLRDTEADELLAPAPVGGRGAGARAQLTVEVDDVDAAVEALGARGVPVLNGPLDRPWGIRTAALADPDGHVWELAGPVAGG